MRILADENFPSMAVQDLRNDGHDVNWIYESNPGATDTTVLRTASDENRLLMTFDKDFGELAFRFGLPASCGIILFRLRPSSPRYVARAAVNAIQAGHEWPGHFSVVEDHRIRQTPLPP